MNKKTVLIMKTGETLGLVRAGGEDFEDWMRAGLGLDAHAAPAVSVHLGQPLPEASTLAGVVITGSPAMLTDGAHWNVVAAHWLRDLGVGCLQGYLFGAPEVAPDFARFRKGRQEV